MRQGVGTITKAARRAAAGLAVAVVATGSGSVAGLAQEASGSVVVELYTSQGCSSCPPADEFMAELAQAEHVIALSLHVDYWDYIGWADAFADPGFTLRQKAYARAAGSRMIYTPQMIVGGVDRVEGNTPDAVVRAVGRHLAAEQPVRLTVVRSGARVTITALADAPLARGAVVQLVRYAPLRSVTIGRGENAGRTIDYHNVVTLWQTLGDWSGVAPFEMVAEAPGDEPVVVIVQEDGPAAILAAARVE